MKMPWSKKPSESALTGTGPSALAYPQSPASKQTPNAIASTAAGKAPTASSSMAPASSAMAPYGGPKATSPAFGAPTAPNATAAGYKAPTTGVASAANGYATGPYNTFGQSGPAASLAIANTPNRPATPVPNQFTPPAPPTASGYAAANPYAPPASAATNLPSSQAYGSGLAASAYGNRPPNSPASSQPNPGFGAPTSMGQFAAAGQPAAPALSPPTTPVGFAAANPTSMPVVNPMTAPAAGGAYSPVGSNPTSMNTPNGYAQATPGNPSANSGFAMPNTQSSYAPNGSMGQVPAQTAAYATPAPHNNYTAAAYRPGSTSRPTGYNFAPQGTAPGVAAPNNNPQYTAGSNSNPGYSLPPSATLNR